MTATVADPTKVPGPVDRVHFLDEQRRYRKASRRFSALALCAVLITAIPACIVVTPLVYTVLLTIGHIANAISPISPETIAALRGSLDIIEAVDAVGNAGVAAALRLVIVVLPLVLPGAIAILVLWFANRRLIGQVVVGHALEGTIAREPNVRDLEEQQLGNVVEEMAVAAGIRPPRLLIVNSEAVNAACIGLGVDNATVLVTRGLLDKLDRDETQAVVGHVIGSIGNGDLKIASIIYSIYQTWGAVALLIDAPFSSAARKVIWRAIRAAFRAQGRTVDRWEAEQVSDALVRGAKEDDAEAEKRMASKRPTDNLLTLVSLPSMLASYVVRFAVFVSSRILGGLIALMWRSRRHLADAMAVQLTRNPDALARALGRLQSLPSAVSQGSGVAMLFFTWPWNVIPEDAVTGEFARMHPKIEKRQRRLLASGADPALMGRLAGPFATFRQVFAGITRRNFRPTDLLLAFAFFVVVPILSVVATGLMLFLLVVLTVVTVGVMLVLMLIVTKLLSLLFITIPAWIRAR